MAPFGNLEINVSTIKGYYYCMKDVIADTTILIDAPLEKVWQVLLDTENYSAWNPFVVKAEAEDGVAMPGNKMKLFVRWKNGKGTSSTEIIDETKPLYTDINGRKRTYWSYRFTGLLHKLGLVHAICEHMLEQFTNGKTAYRTREEFTGLFKYFIPLADVQDGFERQTEALKKEAEKR